ncbi:hypothetical protein [Alkalihalobacillus trypoxylicola]|uniref:Uncharacterized protein n=1 Tax=Alkalihalobacillus trypoxylicola TaxID=519424 RepID=A0A162F4J2_9BACI|nr:hypothetical protein [Alkalihalobacillus trypoxylicola]KYG34790.1 hypothetical protein AZF04_00190 [Alkalihalobacillus trypoxylicola]GAF64582.1 4-diphosphocytidyl-2-methyl-D-erithritol synthase [Bacillus sp. TS-2]
MKQYVFLYCLTKENQKVSEQHHIQARGMLDAFKKANKIKQTLEAETLETVEIELKGILY